MPRQSERECAMFSIRKILQALYYIQQNAPASNSSRKTYMFLLKILYFADRFHLRRYGFIASCDKYCAMKLGPVASATYDVLRGKLPRGANSAEIQLLGDVVPVDEYSVEIQPQEQDELSQSFIDALDFSITEFGNYTQFQLSDMTHDFPEWARFKDGLENGDKKEYDILLTDFFADPVDQLNMKKYRKKNPYTEDAEFLDAMKADLDDGCC